MNNKAIVTLIGLSFCGAVLAADNQVATVVNSNIQTNSIAAQTEKLAKKVAHLQRQIRVLRYRQRALRKKQAKNKEAIAKHAQDVASPRYSHGLAVVSSLFVGLRDGYSVYDLIVNLPSMNQDLVLLKQRQKMVKYAQEHGEVIPQRPLIDLSGSVEGDLLYHHDYVGSSKTDLTLSGAQLDVMAEVSSWATAAAFFTYEDTPPVTGVRVDNSRMKLDRGFLTIGNLNKSPFYATLGQMFMPFGLYSSFMVTSPMTKLLARVKTRGGLLGLNMPCGFYGSAYAFKGDSFVHNGGIVNNWGVNTGFGKAFGHFDFNFGAGFIANMADAQGMQDSVFKSSDAVPDGYEQLQHRIPGIDAHITLGYHPFENASNASSFNLVAEYITPLRRFAVEDLRFNGVGARPIAADLEGAYNFQIAGKNSSLAIGMGLTRQALGLELPKQSYFASFSANLLPYTIESIEYRHDCNYASTNTAGGGENIDTSPTGRRDRNIVTARVGLYF